MARQRTIVQVLAQRVRELRESQALTQADLARASGLAPSQIFKLERGTQESKLPTIETIARALGVTVSELLAVGATANPLPDRAARLAERVRRLGDEAIGGLEHVVDAMEHLAKVGGRKRES